MSNLMKKFFALLLALSMVTGVMPISAIATEVSEDHTIVSELPSEDIESEDSMENESEEPQEDDLSDDENLLVEDEGIGYALEGRAVGDTIYVLAGGDFQEAGDHAGSAENVRNILAQISQKYSSMDGFLFVGDYDCETHEADDNGQTAAGITALMDAVQYSYSNINDGNSILVQGNHDIKESRIDSTGGHDFDGYSVFVMNEDDYPDGGGTETGVQALANNLKSWLNDKLGEGYDAPIFVTSHLPLAFSPRTNVVGDGKYAKLIFDVLNQAAEDGLNIIFMHGHNHAYGNDNYLGGEAIYLAKGDEINIAELGSTTKWTEETLNFTYMNAGYVGYYNDWNYVTTEGTDKLTMTVFAITGSEVTVERYSANGLYNLKSEGRNGRYVRSIEASADSLGLTYNTTVYSSPQTISLSAVEDYGSIGSWVSVGETYYVAEGNGLYIVDKNTTETDAMAKVKEGVTVYSATDTNGSNKTPISDEDVIWNWVDKYNGADFGPYTVEILKDGTSLGTVEVKVDVKYEPGIDTDWTYIGETEATGGSYTYTLDTDGIDYGEENKYIIVDDNEAIVLNANSASNGTAHSITISGNTATLNTRDYEYHMIQTSYNGTRYELITKGDGSQYLYQESNGVRYGTRSSVKFQVNHHGNGIYDIHDIDGTNWYIIYNGGWTVTETTSARVRLYKYTGTTGGTPGGPIYALIEGNTVYTVTQGSSATKALAAVKAGITGYISGNADGSDPTELDDSDLTWTWKNTFNGNSTGSYWVEVSYQGKVLGTVEVQVVPGVVNNYPEYPDEGAVKVNKTATGIDFQSSGIAQVEISASGVPVKKGADVIIMLDTSSSMESWCVCGVQNCSASGDEHRRRSAVLEQALTNLIAQFKQNGDDGEPLDIRVALADFNGFYSTGPIARDDNDTMADNISYSANSQAQVYTGTRDLSYGAFINAVDMADSYSLNYASGTNYDYAFDAIYQLGEESRNSGEDRDLYVIFMSDGAAMQWNYYHSQGQSDTWGEWITGTYAENELASAVNCGTHTYYYNLEDTNGDGKLNEHRMANAVKGSRTETFEVIRKGTEGIENLTSTSTTDLYTVPGLGATVFSIAFDPTADGNVEAQYMTDSIATLASEQIDQTQYYYVVDSAQQLGRAFSSIGSAIAYAANNARFVDQLGDNFNLQLLPYKYLPEGETDWNNAKEIEPKIEIISYDIYTKADADANNIPDGKNIGDRKGTYTALETITTAMVEAVMDADGKYTGNYNKDENGNYVEAENGQYRLEVYSDKIDGGTTNILADGSDSKYVKGVIYAKTFLYNTNVLDVEVEGVNIPTGTNADGTTKGSSAVLESEAFYWKMGTVQTSELAMRYYVYLEGSMEGTAEKGSYSTNEFAVLYYDNYLGNPCYKDTVSPSVAWKSANVSYAFYLVNEDGEIIVNQTTGQTGSFANKIAVTNPVVYEEILLNNTDQVRALNVKAISEDVLPRYYTLYDESSVYSVSIYSNGTGSWEIMNVNNDVHAGPDGIEGTKDDISDWETNDNPDLKQTTYVTQYKSDDPSAYSKAVSNDTIGDDYTHTIVWFAVVWKVQAHPDTVVVDYGLPVDISVLTNDMFGENGKLEAIGPYSEGLEGTTGGDKLADGFSVTYSDTDNYLKYGTAEANTATGKVRYTLKTMEMPSYEKFAYAVNYTGSTNAGYYYDTITVIPATTIYYEDGFLTYTGSNTEWKNAVENYDGSGYLQDEDRPGKYSLTDANNIYGYDSVNKGMSTYSLGNAKKVHVDAGSYATAEFTFAGTGFDVISMTSNTTGTLLVQVKTLQAITFNGTDYDSGTNVKNGAVSTYYGYTSEIHEVLYTYTAGEWVAEDMGVAKESTVVTAKPEEPKENDTYTAKEQVWIATPDTANALFQIPVMQVEDLPYGRYQVTIKATYANAFDKTTDPGYDLYLDAIRIYDPANDGAADGDSDKTIENAYAVDGEGWPSYIELRNKVISANSFDKDANEAMTNDMEGLVFIDGDASVGNAQISDYISYGPNNEVYLAPGQRVAFMLSDVTKTEAVTDEEGKEVIREFSVVDQVHIGIKSADGGMGTYTITNIASADRENSVGDDVSKGQYYNARTFTIDTTTDMYYDLTGWKGDIIVISNTGDRYNTTGIISLTNIKSTYTSDPNGTVTTNEGARTSVAAALESNETYVYMTRSAAQLVVKALEDGDILEKAPEIVIPEETEPEETEPEETEPEETEPEETEPEGTEPEETEPEETEPEETEPEETEPEETEPEETEPEETEPEETEPEETEPEGTEPEETEPEETVPEETEPEETEPEETEPEETKPQDKPFDPGKVKLPFKDIKKDSWYQEGVAYVYFYKLMNGIDDDEFAPGKAMTRAMVVTVLHRLAGEPETNFNAKYSDVKANKYYSNAINWATENGIAYGVGNNKFDPDGEVTREQLATMLYRYCQLKGYDLTTDEDLLDFPDFDEVSKWSKDGMKWAVGKGIINGNKKGNVIMLDPASNALRSQIAVILQRFCENFK